MDPFQKLEIPRPRRFPRNSYGQGEIDLRFARPRSAGFGQGPPLKASARRAWRPQILGQQDSRLAIWTAAASSAAGQSLHHRRRAGRRPGPPRTTSGNPSPTLGKIQRIGRGRGLPDLVRTGREKTTTIFGLPRSGVIGPQPAKAKTLSDRNLAKRGHKIESPFSRRSGRRRA